MNEHKYTGLCVGGPRDGFHASSATYYFKVVGQLDLRLNLDPGPNESRVQFHVPELVYLHVSVLGSDFWVLQDETSGDDFIAWVLKKLSAGYKPLDKPLDIPATTI